MNKLLLALIAITGLLLAPASALAGSHSGSNYTEVTGRVHHHDRHSHKDAKVTVSCDGHTRTARTDSNDNYSVRFDKSDCKSGSWINVSSDYRGEHGTSHHKSDGKDRCHIDVDPKPPVTDVPEFSSLATIGAGLVGSVSFLVIRRRQISGRHS